MTRHRVGLAGPGVLSDARSDDHRHRQGGHSADRVHHSGAREVAIAMAQPIVDAELRRPSTAPCPIAIERVNDCSEEEGRDREGEELPALGCGARDDRRGGVHEDHLEQEHHHHANIVGWTAQEKSALTEQTPRLSADEIERKFAS